MSLGTVRPIFAGISSGTFLTSSLLGEKAVRENKSYPLTALMQFEQVNFALEQVSSVLDSVKVVVPNTLSWICYGAPFVVSFLQSRDIQNLKIKSVVNCLHNNIGRLAIVISLVSIVASLVLGSTAYATSTLIYTVVSALSIRKVTSQDTASKLATLSLVVGNISILVFGNMLHKLFFAMNLCLQTGLNIFSRPSKFIPTESTTLNDYRTILSQNNIEINKSFVQYDWSKEVPQPECEIDIAKCVASLAWNAEAIRKIFAEKSIACEVGKENEVLKARFLANLEVLSHPLLKEKRAYILKSIAKSPGVLVCVEDIAVCKNDLECFHAWQKMFEVYASMDSHLSLKTCIFARLQLMRRLDVQKVFDDDFEVFKKVAIFAREDLIEVAGREFGLPRYYVNSSLGLSNIIIVKGMIDRFWDIFNFEQLMKLVSQQMQNMNVEAKQWWRKWIERQKDCPNKGDMLNEISTQNKLEGLPLHSAYAIQTFMLDIGVIHKT